MLTITINHKFCDSFRKFNINFAITFANFTFWRSLLFVLAIGDYKVLHPSAIAMLYNRKRNHYWEGAIYPAIEMDDFKPELFQKVRNLIRNNSPAHPWLNLGDEQLLLKAGLYGQDAQTKHSGYNLAAVLLFGKDETIQRVLPHYKIDALLRRGNVRRYDDRMYIQCNLIEAYDQLMDYTPGRSPKFVEDRLFQTIIPLRNTAGYPENSRIDAVNDAVNGGAGKAVKARLVRELSALLQGGMSLSEIMNHFNIQSATAQRDMKLLKQANFVEFRGACKTGVYVPTAKGRALWLKYTNLVIATPDDRIVLKNKVIFI